MSSTAILHILENKELGGKSVAPYKKRLSDPSYR